MPKCTLKNLERKKKTHFETGSLTQQKYRQLQANNNNQTMFTATEGKYKM